MFLFRLHFEKLGQTTRDNPFAFASLPYTLHKAKINGQVAPKQVGGLFFRKTWL